MNYCIVEDSELAKRNQSLLRCSGSGISYNAVLTVTFDEGTPVEPVTLQEAKDWCRVDIDDDDAIITALIKAARTVCENYANLSFIPKTITAKIYNGLGGITLPYGPVVTITAVTDSNSIDILTDFSLDTRQSNNITVVYTAGYTTLPENFKTAIKNQIGFLYENRGSERMNTGVAEFSKLLLNQVRSV